MPPVEKRPQNVNPSARPAGSNRLPRPIMNRRNAETLDRMVRGFGRHQEESSEDLKQLQEQVRPGRFAADITDDPLAPVWAKYTGWALKVLTDPPPPPSRDPGDCLAWLGEGQPLEHFESPDLSLLREALRPHEHGRHPADVYGLGAMIDRARVCGKIHQRRRIDNHQRAEALGRI